MTHSPFRPEVIAARRQSWLGEIRVKTPLWLGACSLLAILSLFVALIVFLRGSYSQYVRVSGRAVADTQTVLASAGATGSIARILVGEGARVRAGDVLALISQDPAAASPDSTKTVAVASPIDGIVVRVSIHLGDTVQAATTAFALLPEANSVRVVLLVPEQVRRVVATADRIDLFAESHGQRNPEPIYAAVAAVASVASSDAQIAALRGEPTKYPLYRVDLELPGKREPQGGLADKLAPGTAVTATIPVARKRLIALLVPRVEAADTIPAAHPRQE